MGRAGDIQEEIRETRRHIEETGAAMVEKLELLEKRLREGIDGVKRNFDLHYQADQHPLALFGGSLLFGYLLGLWFGGRSRDSEPSYRPRPSRTNGIGDHLKREMAATMKGMAAGALTGALWKMAGQALFGRGWQGERGTRREGRG